MPAYALPRRRAFRQFPTSFSEDRANGLTSRLAAMLGLLVIMVAIGFTVFELALKTADQVFIDQAMLTPPEQADVTFGRHRLSFPGQWLTSPLALDDEMATSAAVRLPYDKLLTLIGASSAVDMPDGTNPHDVVIRFQIPTPSARQIDLFNEIYVPKSVPVLANEKSGLKVRRFLAKTGYDGEYLYSGKVGESAFIARCLAPTKKAGDIVRRPCLYLHPISDDLEAVVQFDLALLADWRMMGRQITALVNSISVRR